MTSAIFTLTLFFAVIYTLFLLWCIAGWLRLKSYRPAVTEGPMPVVSVIIPARNEESNISACLSDLIIQDYPKDCFEVIVVDDHSSDRTAEFVSSFIKQHASVRITLLRISEDDARAMYKKHAIAGAVKISKGELIMTTDADCRRGKRWISTIASYYRSHHPEMISAPVVFEKEKNWFEKFQSLEFLGLIAIGAGSVRNHRPLLCNGANLAFSKKVFESLKGYQSANPVSSGDDTQLMFKIALRGKERIHFVKSEDAMVFTAAQHTLSGLLKQRRRWASKIPVQMNALSVAAAVSAYLLHAGLLLSLLLILSGSQADRFIVALAMKLIAEFVLLMSAAVFFKKVKVLSLFLPAQVFYPLYICTVGLSALFGKYEWKGRRLK